MDDSQRPDDSRTPLDAVHVKKAKKKNNSSQSEEKQQSHSFSKSSESIHSSDSAYNPAVHKVKVKAKKPNQAVKEV